MNNKLEIIEIKNNSRKKCIPKFKGYTIIAVEIIKNKMIFLVEKKGSEKNE